MMDATYTAVLRLWEQNPSMKDIARLNISHGKVLKILVTAGALETEESKLYAQGKTVPEIAQILGKSEKAVFCRVPYEKGMYGAEYPTINALRIRKCRGKGEKNEHRANYEMAEKQHQAYWLAAKPIQRQRHYQLFGGNRRTLADDPAACAG